MIPNTTPLNGSKRHIIPSSLHRLRSLLPTFSHPYLLETPTSQTPCSMSGDCSTDSSMDDLIHTPYQVGSRDIPVIPVDAIGTLQQASADMLQALVRKDAADREKKLLIAVGTMRTCLDIEFIPYLDAWKEGAKSIRTASEGSSSKGASKRLTMGTSGPPRKSRCHPRVWRLLIISWHTYWSKGS